MDSPISDLEMHRIRQMLREYLTERSSETKTDSTSNQGSKIFEGCRVVEGRHIFIDKTPCPKLGSSTTVSGGDSFENIFQMSWKENAEDDLSKGPPIKKQRTED